MAKSKSYWLVKTEPDSFSIHDLAASPKKTTCWDGVRNYLARNHMRAMQLGDEVLFYHSSTEPPAVVGIAVVVRPAYPDPTAWTATDHHFDPKASPENPIWDMVDLRLEKIFPAALPLERLRGEPRLAKMELLRRGSRLSVQPVGEAEFRVIEELAESQTLEVSSQSGPATNKKARKRPAAVSKRNPSRAAKKNRSRRK